MDHNKEQKSLERFSEKYIKELEVEVPPLNFTSSVMDTIIQQEIESAKVYEYTPLISKRTWIILSTFFTIIIVFVLRTSPSSIFSNFNYDLNFPSINIFEGIKFFTISKITSFILSFLLLMILSQFYFFKKVFERN
ncbi:hypothetical protein [Tenacibaculum jejuense]|uniref:DUF1700 domain-containing protein n=1 Tax=Tenacibaculum jejuense TaxID=584609 RepID=A0A238U8I9_9FLAO|nr:hypothetical protein [Tenacibaculum jejuense]SNR15422.1 conserved protein of unknown function [Tenacibaculum jejuense]